MQIGALTEHGHSIGYQSRGYRLSFVSIHFLAFKEEMDLPLGGEGKDRVGFDPAHEIISFRSNRVRSDMLRKL
jgi:hypothetical protein